MERESHSCDSCSYKHRQRTQQEVNPIVDDPRSSNPHTLLPWLKRQLQMFTSVNNVDYNPTLPTTP